MKRIIFKLELTGLGDNEEEAKHDAITELLNSVYNYKEFSSWLVVKSIEEVEEE